MVKAATYYKKHSMTGDEPWDSQSVQDRGTVLEVALKKQKDKPKKKKKKGEKKPPKSPPKKDNGPPSWKTNNTPPKTLTQTKTLNNKAWYWCCKETGGKCDGRWRAHKPSDCLGMGKPKDGEKKR